jgi:hypothetical protein
MSAQVEYVTIISLFPSPASQAIKRRASIVGQIRPIAPIKNPHALVAHGDYEKLFEAYFASSIAFGLMSADLEGVLLQADLSPQQPALAFSQQAALSLSPMGLGAVALSSACNEPAKARTDTVSAMISFFINGWSG